MQKCTSCGASIETGNYKCSNCATVVDEYKSITHSPAYASANYDAPPPKISRYSTVGVWSYVGSLVLLFIPILGLIICIVWACGGAYNKNRVNLARAFLLISFFLFIIGCIMLSVFYYTGIWEKILLFFETAHSFI